MCILCRLIKNPEVQDTDSDSDIHQAYGLEFFCPTDPSYHEVVNDISSDRTAIEILSNIINSNGLDEVHIFDIIEDFL